MFFLEVKRRELAGGLDCQLEGLDCHLPAIQTPSRFALGRGV